jgi:hypothetical protein
MAPGLARRKHFLRALLEGQVCPALKAFRLYHTLKPHSICQPVPPTKAKALMAAAAAAGVETKAALEARWASHPTFLLAEALPFFNVTQHPAITKVSTYFPLFNRFLSLLSACPIVPYGYTSDVIDLPVPPSTPMFRTC